MMYCPANTSNYLVASPILIRYKDGVTCREEFIEWHEEKGGKEFMKYFD